ncbi:hypothetical protein B5F17_01755 [Butyricicoccus pullicaecorum]|uniref:Uncharacterized protein n=1 Tax=Butyricicoccus pullicaecorum TaxID=501571 RepID=A0A1Y4LDJ3_9FIRM|nr:hypothetical protein B5F17_01755 [Butyricicoccus pullicaecorum]
MNLTPRTGRPVGEDGRKDKLLQIRVDQKTLSDLDDCAAKLQTSRSDVIRKGIQLVSEQLAK